MTDTDGHGRLRCRWAVAGRHAPLGQDVPRTVGERARARPWEEQGTEGNSLSSLLHGARGTLLGENTRMGCHSLLQGIFLTQGLNLGLLH